MLKTENLSKKYAHLRAVEKLNLELAPGELFGFLGPNGAGKTTTIKMLTGILAPTTGRIYLGGHDLAKEPVAAKSLLGYVPDEPVLYEKLTGREYLDFLADIYQVKGPEREKRSTELLELLGLTDRAHDLIQGYSRGMRRKLALAGALIHNPQILILDEPTLGLDPASARLLKEILLTLTNRGVTVFMSTHILEVAQHMCSRVGIINKGQLIACGTMAELQALAQGEDNSLEDIFLRLTGGAEDCDMGLLGEGGQQ